MIPCCAPATLAVGQGFAISNVYSPGNPPPAGPANIASANVTVTNPFDFDAVGKFDFTLQANKNLHGSVSVDVQIYAAFDGGLEGATVQDLQNLTGPIANNPAVGGDGTLLGTRNGMHNNHASAGSRVSGGLDGIIPALITPGAHTLAIRLEMISSGLWDDPANPGDNFAFWLGTVTWNLGVAV